MVNKIYYIDEEPEDGWKNKNPENPWLRSYRRLLRNRGAVAGGLILLALVLVAIFAPVIAPYDPLEGILSDRLKPPSYQHIMGTDPQGRDLFSRIIFGARLSLQLGFISVGIAAFFGIIFGTISGYFGGLVDQIIMRVMDIMLAFPGILLALSIIAVLGPGFYNVMIAIGLSWIPKYTRIVRSSTLSAREKEYVSAAKALGCSDSQIISRHILHNIMSPIIVLCSMDIGVAILVGAALSFLGLGAQPPTPEWGSILDSGRRFINTSWWVMSFPGLAIMITVLAANLLGDGLRGALDPRLKS
jgi:peptide/nickel transport system permease protein